MVSVAQLVEPRIVIPVVVGSSPIVHPIFCTVIRFYRRVTCNARFLRPSLGQLVSRYGLLAQLVEQLTLNQRVQGSNP